MQRRDPGEVADPREVGEVPCVRRKAEVVEDLDRIGSICRDPVDAAREREGRRPLDDQAEIGCRRGERDERGDVVGGFDRAASPA